MACLGGPYKHLPYDTQERRVHSLKHCLVASLHSQGGLPVRAVTNAVLDLDGAECLEVLMDDLKDTSDWMKYQCCQKEALKDRLKRL